MATHNITGAQGEDMAENYFTERNYTILHRNWRYKNAEVDIIATKNKCLHFIEVKTLHKTYNDPEFNVNNKKLTKLKEAAEGYLYKNPQWKIIQFDVLAITLHYNCPTEYYLIEDVY
jgi:putative endonuclease